MRCHPENEPEPCEQNQLSTRPVQCVGQAGNALLDQMLHNVEKGKEVCAGQRLHYFHELLFQVDALAIL